MRRVMAVLAAALLLTGCAPATVEPSSSAVPPPASAPAPEPSTTLEPAASPAPPPPPATAAPAPTADPGSADGVDIDDGASLQVVVNKRRPLVPVDYQPALVPVSVAQDGDETVRPELDAALTRVSAAMQADIGEGVHVFSSYRSFSRQTQLYDGYVAQYGQARADTTSARPGHSEHQTGLAVDVMGTGGACRLDACFGDTAAGRWIAEHGWEHGFVVRYPRGLDAVTGYAWEPWHLRYVGPEVSAAMHEQGTATLEEHFGLEPAPDYG